MGPPLTESQREAIRRFAEGSVYAAFAAVAQRRASSPALITPDGAWSYDELAATAGRLHALLAARGVAPGVGVGLMFSDPRWQIAAMLGVLRAGGFYVFLDPEFPAQRLRDVIADGAVTLIVTEPARVAEAATLSEERVAVVGWAGGDEGGVAPAPAVVASDATAYVVYTSGSTGRPKGVVQPHANLLHEVAVHRATLGLGDDDRASLLYSPGVIGAVRDIFGMLLTGGALCPFPFKRRGFAELAAWLRAQRVTQLHAVPILFRELIEALAPGEVLGDVRVVFIAGDRVEPADVAKFRRHFAGEARFYTGIGATEANSIYTHWFVEGDAAEVDGRLPTGWPLPDKEVWLVDETRQPVAPGEPGEIAVCSRFLATGYWNRPELTAAAFAEAGDGSGRRIYYTGDHGVFDAAGRLVHLGRRDQQVKINGERLELGGIERALRASAGVEGAVVRVFHPGGGRPRLIAYVAAEAVGFDQDRLRGELAVRLSRAAIPAVIVRLDALPLTANGKIDVQALPAPMDLAAESPADASAMADWSPTERAVGEIWREVFPGGMELSRTQTFEQLGGDSLQAVRLGLLLKERCGFTWPASLTVHEASIARIAAECAGQPSRPPTDDPGGLLALAALWKMAGLGTQVVGDLPAFLAGADQPGLPLIWIGQPGFGSQIGWGLAQRRPVWLLPTLATTSTLGQAGAAQVWDRVGGRLAPHLPNRVVVGGCCASGLQAMLLARALQRQGKNVDSVVMLDAYGSPRAQWRFLQYSRLYDRTRQLGTFDLRAFLREHVRRLVGRWQGRPGAGAIGGGGEAHEPTAVAPDPFFGFRSFGYEGRLLLGLSGGTAWWRWVFPFMGWSVREIAAAKIFVVPGEHKALWSAAGIRRIAEVLEEERHEVV